MPTAPPVIATPWEPVRLVQWLDRIEQAIDRLNLFELLELPPTGSGEHVQVAYHQIARTRHPDLFRGRLSARDAERLMRVYGRISAAYASLRDPNERTRYIYELRQARGRGSSQPPAATAVPDREGVVVPRAVTGPVSVSRTSTGSITGSLPPAVGRTPTPPAVGRTPTGPAVGRTPTGPAVGRTPTGPAAPTVSRTSTDPVSRPMTVSPQPTRPPMGDRPRTASPAVPARSSSLSTPPPLGQPPRLPSAPGTQLAPRALAFYRRAESALAGGDVAAATLNLRMALSADPTSELLRDALAEVQRHGK